MSPNVRPAVELTSEVGVKHVDASVTVVVWVWRRCVAVNERVRPVGAQGVVHVAPATQTGRSVFFDHYIKRPPGVSRLFFWDTAEAG